MMYAETSSGLTIALLAIIIVALGFISLYLINKAKPCPNSNSN